MIQLLQFKQFFVFKSNPIVRGYPVLAIRSNINFVFPLNLLLVSSMLFTTMCPVLVFHLGMLFVLVGLKRSDFDNKQVTFKEHVHREHWMWDYLHFYVLLEEKAPTELTGPESYVKKLIKVGGCVW